MNRLENENSELESDEVSEKGQSRKGWILLILLLFVLLAGFVFWKWVFHGGKPLETVAPDEIYTAEELVDLPDNVPLAEVQADKVPQSFIPETDRSEFSETDLDVSGDDAGGRRTGAVVYSNEVTYHKKDKSLSMIFQNPVSSGSLMVLHLEADGRELWRSGTLPEGYEVTELSGVDLDIDSGKYPAHLYVDHYDPENGDLSVFRLDLECTLYVWEE